MADNVSKDFSPSTIYLCFYNLFLSLGWTILMIQFLSHIIYEGRPGLWNSTSDCLLIFQSLAILEVVHCIVGIVRSSAVLTFLQVSSRLFLTWAILYCLPESRDSLGFPIVLFAWSLTEIVRYLFYFLGLVGVAADFVAYLRYTMFIALYPLGVTGEMLCYFTALPLVQKHRYLSVTLPNACNFSFDSYYAFIIVIVMYIPVFPQLYLHMWAQRRKVLGGSTKQKIH
ncbi:very-long-chain (3R)-3-hydroxyacyl-CoA dehydratase 1-like [Hyalella azteca]|uniref:Very-long-chain (3R)-3-hydroxyacyl-CoA dehydratase n=1 Tax=Hyalella azteca TaxID=294128 RepID=A0A8B7PKM8_HYAAZ|nr:very-long-chain (3R)-3-hydroxyacyl-CoA dehydratase 1-like [Hyalella azteca]